MNISKVIDEVKKLKSGCAVSDEQIISDINKVEMYILFNIVSGREGDEELTSEYGNYDIDTDRDKELLVPSPYDDIYAMFCASQIDLSLEDTERYVNDSIVYKDLLSDFTVWWNRNHRQKARHRYF